jgi:hypothetical protein
MPVDTLAMVISSVSTGNWNMNTTRRGAWRNHVRDKIVQMTQDCLCTKVTDFTMIKQRDPFLEIGDKI